MIEEDSHNEPPHETKSVSLNQLATVLGANSENSGIFIFISSSALQIEREKQARSLAAKRFFFLFFWIY